MDIILNGQPHQLTNVQTLQQELSGKAIAVAVNRRVVASTQWETTQLNAQDTVDVVRAIGGG
jgi:sulfur carrier protein